MNKKHRVIQSLLDKAFAHARQGDMGKFELCLRRVLKLAPLQKEANAHLAWYASQNGRYRESVNRYFYYLLRAPLDGTAWFRFFYDWVSLGLRKLRALQEKSRLLRHGLALVRCFLSLIHSLALIFAGFMKRKARFNRRLSRFYRQSYSSIDFSPIEYYKYSELLFGYSIIQADPSPHPRILDLGSGNSCFPSFLCQEGYQTVCVDRDLEWLRNQIRSRSIHSFTQMHILNADLRALPLLADSVDVITLISTIEHIPDNGDIEMVRQLQGYLKPGGSLIITVPVEHAYSERWMNKSIGFEYKNDAHAQAGFMRIYDYQALHKRLVQPSNLSLASLKIWGETTSLGWAGLGKSFIGHEGKIYPNLFTPLLNAMFVRELDATALSRAYWAVGCIHLRKDA